MANLIKSAAEPCIGILTAFRSSCPLIKEFLEFINKPATPGYFSQFFSAIQDAGIVEKNRMGRSFYYTLGPNYEAFTQGTLKRASE